MEILKLLFTVLAIIIFRSMTWIQISILAVIINTIHYFYSNQDNLKKYITELNANMNFKNSVIIFCYGVPLMMIKIAEFLINQLNMFWYTFKKTSIGTQFYSVLKLADNYLISKKNEMKTNMFSMMMNNALGSMGQNNNDTSGMPQNMQMPPGMPPGMPDLNELLSNPDKMNDMMRNFNNLMTNMNGKSNNNFVQNNSSISNSSSGSSELALDQSKPIMNDDLFNKINEYMDDDDDDDSKESDSERSELRNTIIQTKKVNKKIRRRKKNKVNDEEFNDMKNMTGALEEVLSKLKETN